jgi:hypothetical protein
VVFIITADLVTPNQPIVLTVTEYGRRAAQTFAMPDVHGATMAPIAVGSLAALVGLFAVLDSRDGDRRAALAGLRPGALLAARLGCSPRRRSARQRCRWRRPRWCSTPCGGRPTPRRTR